MLAGWDLLPAASTAVSRARYFPGLSVVVPIRPENFFLLGPATPWARNARTRLNRVHFRLPALERVRLTHLPFTRRPVVLRWIVKVTVAGSDSVNLNVVPFLAVFTAVSFLPLVSTWKLLGSAFGLPVNDGANVSAAAV